MNEIRNKLYNGITNIDDDIIEDAQTVKPKKKAKPLIKWSIIAACLCLVIVGVLAIRGSIPNKGDSNTIQIWSDSMTASDYFKFNGSGNNEGAGVSYDISPPYAEVRSFSDDRETMEADRVIPAIDDHPLFECHGGYNADGSLYSLEFSWQRLGDMGLYSYLTVTAGYQEIEQINDCIGTELDENGNVVEPMITVTERDGVNIVAEGNKNREKTLTYQTDYGWYQISGSWNNTYDDMVVLLEWFWTHPIEFDRFNMGNGDVFTSFQAEELPKDVADYLPDFAELGYSLETGNGRNKNGQFYDYECHYVSGLSREDAQNPIYDSNIRMIVWWVVETDPDYYDKQAVMGQLEDLTQDSITEVLEKKKSITFMWNDYCVTLGIGAYVPTEEGWRIIQSIQ